jgi:hypothetical protein
LPDARSRTWIVIQSVEGKISPETYEEWNRETGGKQLPERVRKARPTTRSRKAAKKR